MAIARPTYACGLCSTMLVCLASASMAMIGPAHLCRWTVFFDAAMPCYSAGMAVVRPTYDGGLCVP